LNTRSFGSRPLVSGSWAVVIENRCYARAWADDGLVLSWGDCLFGSHNILSALGDALIYWFSGIRSPLRFLFWGYGFDIVVAFYELGGGTHENVGAHVHCDVFDGIFRHDGSRWSFGC
jgi:hypothetical protein